MSPENNGTEHLHSVLMRYDMALLRRVADDLLRSRLQRGRADLIDKMTETVENPAVIDRRLRDLTEPQRGLLALLGLGRRGRWELVTVLELLSCLGTTDGLAEVRELFHAGLLYPALPQNGRLLRSFKQWLPSAFRRKGVVYAPPAITARAAQLCVGEWESGRVGALPFSHSLTLSRESATLREADGLEWFLRLGVLWQRVHESPLRLTQQGEFFKKDHDWLAEDLLLTSSAADDLAPLPQLGHGLVALSVAAGLLRRDDCQIVAGEWPAEWNQGLPEAVTHVWSLLPQLHGWNAADGWRGLNAAPSPYDSARLMTMALLAQLPRDAWLAPEAVADWIAERHCYWRESVSECQSARVKKSPRDHSPTRSPSHSLTSWTSNFLLGMAYQLRLVQATQVAGQDSDPAVDSAAREFTPGRWLVRLSPFGRAILGLDAAPTLPAFSRTLLVQPNLEVLAYRQGLTPGLIGGLSQFAAWQSLGAACTLRLQPETVYRGLECGYGMEQTVRLLAQHGVRELPPGVLESLKTWANKRERLTVYSAATLLEFTTAEDAQAALTRGLAGLRIADRLVLVAQESDIDFRHFRLTGTRDYALPPGRCVEIAADGVTLLVDPARSDLLLDTEIHRFAVPVQNRNDTDRDTYRVTPASLKLAIGSGLSVYGLEEWFLHRTGQALSPAIRLLLAGDNPPDALTIRRLLVIEAPSPQVADGLLEWPESRELIQQRLGPRALAIEECNLEALRAKMNELGLLLQNEPPDGLDKSEPAA